MSSSALEKTKSQLQSHQKQRKLFQDLFARCTGVIVSAVSPELRQLSSAGSIFIFQQLGYALAPFLSGAIGQAAAGGSTPEASIDDLGSGLVDLSNSTLTYNPQETIVAFWVCMSWSGVGVVFIFYI